MLLNILKNSLLYSLGSISTKPFFHRKISSFIDHHSIKLNPIPRFERRSSVPFQILLYHRILPEDDPFAIGVVTVENFREQIKNLNSYFRIVTLDDLISELEIGKLQPNTICITFDDGYYDNYQYAFPILKEFRIPATIFLTTDLIGSQKMLWHDKVLQIIKNTEIDNFRLKINGRNTFNLTNINKKKEVANELLEWMKKLLPEEREQRIQELKKTCQIEDNETKRLMLNWNEVKEMHNAGISFGAHTKNHPILSLLSWDQMKEEIESSKYAIEKILGDKVQTFAYPNGKQNDFDERCKKIVKRAGYKCAVTSYGSVNNTEDDLYELSRFSPWDVNPECFLGRILLERMR